MTIIITNAMRDRSNKPGVVWITGAAGGLGHALATVFAENSWNVFATHHNSPASLVHKNIWSVSLDVTKVSSDNLIQVVERWGTIDLLINNAGVISDHILSQMTLEQWEQVIRVNLTGAKKCIKAVLPIMQQQHHGQIINISSYAGCAGSFGQSNYAAAKSGLLGLTVSLAQELGVYNIRVNAVLPGFLSTPMTAQLTDMQKDRFIKAHVLNRTNTVEEVSRFVHFMAGMENVSGQIFQLDSRIMPWS